jgi:hypothetical protein
MRTTIFRLGLTLSILANAGSCHVNSASTAHVCNTAITASMNAQQIADVLVARGIDAVRAAKVAQAVRVFRMSVEAACGLVAAPVS